MKLVYPASVEPIVEPDRTVSRVWQRWLGQLSQRMGYSRQPVRATVSHPAWATKAAADVEIQGVEFPRALAGINASFDCLLVLPENFSAGGAVTLFARFITASNDTGNEYKFEITHTAGSPSSAAVTETLIVSGAEQFGAVNVELPIDASLVERDTVAFVIRRVGFDAEDTGGDLGFVAFGAVCDVYDIGRIA